MHLKDHPNAREIMDSVIKALMQREINVALLGGQKYMVDDCLGLKASAGEFTLRLANPSFRFEGTGVALTFGIDRISMNALTVRMRPNLTNPANPCHFGKRFGVGGSASNVRMEMRFDPILDLGQCKVGSMGKVHAIYRIGWLNLKPLQNNLDEMAKNMIEDSLTYFSELNATDRIIAGINGYLGLQCHK